MTREQMIDEAVRRVTTRNIRELLIDHPLERWGWGRDVKRAYQREIRAEFRRIAAAQ